MSSTRARHTKPLLKAGPALLSAIALLTSSVAAEIPDVTWEDPEVVDTGAVRVSSPSGVSVVFADGSWHVVYEKEGDIYRRARSFEGWLPVERLTDDPGLSVDPHIARSDGDGASFLTVVWEDDRTGHAEVWSRRWDGSEWSSEECLTCDETESRAPVVTGGHEYRDLVLVAWEEAAAGEPEAILGRFAEDGVWEAVQEISQSPSSAVQPTAGLTPGVQTFHVAWADDRHGPTEIYLRTYRPNSWLDEERLTTHLPGDCRYPSLHGEDENSDAIRPFAFVLFEHDLDGPEIYGVCRFDKGDMYWDPVSPDDGVPSTCPAAGGFALYWEHCRSSGGPEERLFATWTDETAPASSTHPVGFQKRCLVDSGSDLLTEAGASFSTVAAAEGEPEAGVMALWVESEEGTSSLWSQRGSTPGCDRLDLLEDPAPSVVLAPEGLPSNTYLFGDTCTGRPQAGVNASLRFNDYLDAALTWDPLQDHPEIDAETNADGEAVFALRGGGCSEQGSVWLGCSGVPIWSWIGAKSPDVDGDCIVTDTDLDYVEAMVGSDDFCADLDGSGLVDGADRAIVVATLGDHCSHVTAAPDLPWDEGKGPWLRLLPSPCRDASTIRLSLPEPAAVQVRILDAAGRLVRNLTTTEAPAGVTEVVWDTRDERGRPVASGAYFVSVSTGDRVLRRPVLVIR